MTSPTAKGLLATGHCSNDCSLSASETEINPGGSRGSLRGTNASASRKVSGLQLLWARPALWTAAKTEDAGWGQSPAWRVVSWAMPAGWDQHSHNPAACLPQSRCLASGSLSLFPLSSDFKGGIFFKPSSTEVKIQVSPLHVGPGSQLRVWFLSPHISPWQSLQLLGAGPKVTGIHPSASLCLRRWL